MKKISSIMLSLVLLLNLSITVFAKEDAVATASDAGIINIAITWGAMNFTYSDEKVDGSDKGWTCETGANTVKLVNNGIESIVARISYKQADGYTAISGKFDKASETIAKDGIATFTLTLSGKPDAALSGAEIGSVTVTITNADDQSNAVAIADEDGDDTAEGVNETEDSNAALDEEPNDNDTVTNTEENVENGDEPDAGANETEDSNVAPDEESNGDEIMTDTGDDVENGNEPNEGAESKTDDQNTALDEGPNDTDTVTDTVEDTEEVSSEVGDEGQTIK